MLSVCELILQRQMPLEAEGTQPLPGLHREALILYRIYERFVANFYRLKLKGWEVTAQKRLDWHAEQSNQWGKPIYDSSHLYQLYAYLRSQEQLSETHRLASGIVLYPSAQYGLSENFQLQEHMIRMECVDLTAPWQDVENYLLDLVGKF